MKRYPECNGGNKTAEDLYKDKVFEKCENYGEYEFCNHLQII